MNYAEQMQLMAAFAEARRLVNDRKAEVAGANTFAWRRLGRISKYLGDEQLALGRQMFADPQTQEMTA